MAKIFSFASWNVEHFNEKFERVQKVAQFVKASNPDVFAIFEVEGKRVFDEFVNAMPTHHFFVTEGEQTMETLIGLRSGVTAFVSQRESLKSKIPTLRPGVLVTLTRHKIHYSLLFLHLKSAADPVSWGLRDDMMGHTLNLKKALDNRAGANGASNFICLGDLNTMGLNVTYSDKDMDATEELSRYEKRLAVRKMRLLPKTAPHTWWNGPQSSYPKCNLDHVLASDHLKFKNFQGHSVEVRGWPQLAEVAAQQDWINQHSDHAMLYGEVHS